MGLSISLVETRPTEVYTDNITHNLGKMAQEAGLYKALWRPEEQGWTKAFDIIPHLEAGLDLLKSDPDRFKQFDSPNGGGLYVHFVPFVERLLEACRENTNAEVQSCR